MNEANEFEAMETTSRKLKLTQNVEWDSVKTSV